MFHYLMLYGLIMSRNSYHFEAEAIVSKMTLKVKGCMLRGVCANVCAVAEAPEHIEKCSLALSLFLFFFF